MGSRVAAEAVFAAGCGLASRRDMLAEGVHRNWITRQLASERLFEPLPGVISAQWRGTDAWGRIRAALLYAGPRSAVCHLTAAHLWGLAQPPDGAEPVHVAVPHGRKSKGSYGKDVVVHQRGRAPVLRRAGVRVVPAAEALRSLEPDVSIDDPLLAALEAVRVGLVAPDDLLVDAPKRSLRALGLVAEEARAGAVSGGEGKHWRLLKDAGVPLPELNVAWQTPRGRFVVDALWRGLRLGAEIDGRRFHALEHAFEADRARQNAIHVSGVMLIRFPVSLVLGDGTAVVRETVDALRARALELQLPVPARLR